MIRTKWNHTIHKTLKLNFCQHDIILVQICTSLFSRVDFQMIDLKWDYCKLIFKALDSCLKFLSFLFLEGERVQINLNLILSMSTSFCNILPVWITKISKTIWVILNKLPQKWTRFLAKDLFTVNLLAPFCNFHYKEATKKQRSKCWITIHKATPPNDQNTKRLLKKKKTKIIIN